MIFSNSFPMVFSLLLTPWTILACGEVVFTHAWFQTLSKPSRYPSFVPVSTLSHRHFRGVTYLHLLKGFSLSLYSFYRLLLPRCVVTWFRAPMRPRRSISPEENSDRVEPMLSKHGIKRFSFGGF
jgi:hypothetical protein